MTGEELLEFLGDLPPEQLAQDIMVHFQPHYPLQGGLMNARVLQGKPVLAIGDGYEYGTSLAWTDEEEPTPCDHCGTDLDDEGHCWKCMEGDDE